MSVSTSSPEPPLTAADNSGRVGLVIPTLNAGDRWIECLASVRAQSLTPQRLLVVDSVSTDQSVVLAKEAGFEIVRIDRSEFNHGGTRQWAVEYLSDCEMVIFLTQDAILASTESISEIVRC